MLWSKDLNRIMQKNPTHANKKYIATGAKREAEDAIVRRLEILFGDCLNIEKKDEKYYLHNRIKKKWSFTPVAYYDKNNPKSIKFSEWVYDIPRIKEIFWKFVEESINNSDISVSRRKQIFDFLQEINRDLFKSNEERTEYIKSFYESLFGKKDNPKNSFVYNDLEVLPVLDERIDEINALYVYEGMPELFNAFEECIENYEICKSVSFGRELLFENSTENERYLFELLYVELPYDLKDYRGNGYGPTGVIKQLPKQCWEKVHPDIRNKIIEAIDVLCENEEIYKYFKLNTDNEISEIIESVKFKLKWPVYYRIAQDLGTLIDIFNFPEAIDAILEKGSVENFEEDLHRLIEKHFGSHGLKDGSMLDRLIDYREKDLKSPETQLEQYFAETREKIK